MEENKAGGTAGEGQGGAQRPKRWSKEWWFTKPQPSQRFRRNQLIGMAVLGILGAAFMVFMGVYASSRSFSSASAGVIAAICVAVLVGAESASVLAFAARPCPATRRALNAACGACVLASGIAAVAFLVVEPRAVITQALGIVLGGAAIAIAREVRDR